MAIALRPEEVRCPIRIAAVLHIQTEKCANQAGDDTVLFFGLDVACMPLMLQANKSF